jgi:hypothetical protein
MFANLTVKPDNSFHILSTQAYHSFITSLGYDLYRLEILQPI